LQSVDWARYRHPHFATRRIYASNNKALAHLEKLGIVGRLNERRRGRVFSYGQYVELLNVGFSWN
jgi:hypothetical protein